MRAHDFIIESDIPNKIYNLLKAKGYKVLGSGADQAAFLEPGTGLVVKIFGTDTWTDSPALTHEQRSFAYFASYCKANPDNPFLPNFIDWGSFMFLGKKYLQIRMERLFPLAGSSGKWGDELNDIADHVGGRTSPDSYIKSKYNKNDRAETHSQLMLHLGRDGYNQLWNTLVDLKRIAIQKRYVFDLHHENFMLGSDGHIVISDPFYAGD